LTLMFSCEGRFEQHPQNPLFTMASVIFSLHCSLFLLSSSPLHPYLFCWPSSTSSNAMISHRQDKTRQLHSSIGLGSGVLISSWSLDSGDRI
jgi:hypothetical protein